MFTVHYTKIQDNELVENDDVFDTLRSFKMFEIQIKSGLKYHYTLIDWNNELTYFGKPVTAVLAKVLESGNILFEIIIES